MMDERLGGQLALAFQKGKLTQTQRLRIEWPFHQQKGGWRRVVKLPLLTAWLGSREGGGGARL